MAPSLIMRTPLPVLLGLLVLGCGGDNPGADGGGIDARVVPDAAPPADADPFSIPRVVAAACRYTVPVELGLAEGVDYECGDLVAYEDRDQSINTVRVHYVRFFSDATSNNGTIYLAGGPGGNGQSILSYVAYIGPTLLDGLTADGDFLVIAQRGTNLSVPDLTCDTDCSGVDFPSYNTGFNADDVDDLRAALGMEKLNVYGISYGSRLGLEVLRRHGSNVRAAVLGGLVPAQINWPAHVPASFYSALTALDASCAAHSGCSAAYGGLEAKFVTGVESLNANPVSFTHQGNQIDLDGYTYASLLFRLLYSKSTFPWLPLMISDLAERRTDRVGSFIGDVLDRFLDDSGLSVGLYYSVVCGELFNPPDESAFSTANAAVPANIREMFSYNWYSILQTCESWPVGAPRPTLSQPVTSPVPTFVASGALDPITPPSFGTVAAQGLSASVEVVFSNSGHGATLQSTCGLQTFLAFLADPSTAPDTSCAATVTTDYVLPSALTAWSLPPAPQLRFELASAPLPPAMLARLKAAVRRVK